MKRLEMEVCKKISTPANERSTTDDVAIAKTRGEVDTGDGHALMQSNDVKTSALRQQYSVPLRRLTVVTRQWHEPSLTCFRFLLLPSCYQCLLSIHNACISETKIAYFSLRII